MTITRRILITGSSGFVGSHLRTWLQAERLDSWGVDLAGGQSVERTICGDLRDQLFLRKLLIDLQPDTIFHLAGILKSDDPQQFYASNVSPTVSLFETILHLGIRPRVVIASSSAVYGATDHRNPLTETVPLRPVTHYGITKLAQELIALRYWRTDRIPVIVARTFNLLGPGLSPLLACSAFAKQIAEGERSGANDPILTGDLTAFRDFLDVRDAVHAYSLLAEHGRPGITYNVCSGRPVSIQQCLDQLLTMAQMPRTCRLDPARRQTHDVPFQVGSCARLHRLTGWTPAIPLVQSLADLLEDWREKVALS